MQSVVHGLQSVVHLHPPIGVPKLKLEVPMFLFKRRQKWYIEFFDEKKKRTRRISTNTTKKAEAYRFLTDLERKLSEEQTPEESLSLQEFSDRYVEYLKSGHSAKYARDAKAAFKKLIDFTGSVQLDELAPKMLEKFFLSSFNKAKFDTARNYRTIKAAFNRAVEWKNLVTNPLDSVKLPKLPRNIPLYLTDDKLGLVLAQVKNQTIQDILEFGFLTGCRQGEILGLRWTNVDFGEGLVKIANSSEFLTKSKKERLIPMSKRLRELLERRLPESPTPETFVFGKTDTSKYSGNYISRRFKAAVTKAGLDKRLHFHSLRHSTATELIRRNAPVAVVQKLLGHSNISTTMIYTHVTNDDVMEALKKLDHGSGV